MPHPSDYLIQYGRSHTRSPGMFVMRVDSQELPLSAVPLCQAHVFHQPVCERLSLLHHWSILHVHTSPSECGPDPQCQAVQVAHWIWWWQCLAAWHCRSEDHCPVISLQTLEVWLCQWPSLTGMEHCTPHIRAVHMATCLEKEVAGRENW